MLDRTVMGESDLNIAIEKGLASPDLKGVNLKELHEAWIFRFAEVDGISVLIETLQETNKKNLAVSAAEVLKSRADNTFLS